MPYSDLADLPQALRHTLPKHAQEIYQASFNNAWDTYAPLSRRRDSGSREEVSHRVAWSAVKKSYYKQGDTWKRKEE